MRGRCIGFAIICAVVFATGVSAATQEPFPSRPIQLVVPQAPGGAADLHARPLAQALERILRQPVLVINKPGAGSVMGIQFVAGSVADGYTMLIAMPGFFITPLVDALFDRPSKFRYEQFTPIARLSAEPLVMVVHPGKQWRSLTDMVAEAKRRPGDVSYGSSGLYTSLHLQMEIFAASTGVALKHVPYNGAGPAVVALLGGHLDAMASGPGPVLKNIKSGALRALAMSGGRRLAELPDVPTFKELGMDVEYYQQVGVVARRETPGHALEILREATKQAVRGQEFAAAMRNIGTTVAYLDADAYLDLWAKDAKAITTALQRAGKPVE